MADRMDRDDPPVWEDLLTVALDSCSGATEALRALAARDERLARTLVLRHVQDALNAVCPMPIMTTEVDADQLTAEDHLALASAEKRRELAGELPAPLPFPAPAGGRDDAD